MIIHADSNGGKCVVYVKFEVRFFLSQAHALIALPGWQLPQYRKLMV